MSSKRLTRKKRLSKKLSAQFYHFFQAHPPQKVSTHLRCILLDYLGSQAINGLPVDFDMYAWELYDLFNLLDAAALEFKDEDSEWS